MRSAAPAAGASVTYPNSPSRPHRHRPRAGWSRAAPLTRWSWRPPTPRTRTLNGRPGKFDVQGDTQILTFQIAGGRWVVIQAPVSLGWDGAELAKFAGGVQVLGAAQQGRG